MLQRTIDLVSSLEAKNETQQIAKYELIEYTESLHKENQQLKAKIKTYEDPEDLTLMFMYCNEKAKDKIKELEEQLKTKHDGFMASVDEACELAKENQKYKEAINKIKEVCNSIPSTHTICGIEKIHDIENILKEVE